MRTGMVRGGRLAGAGLLCCTAACAVVDAERGEGGVEHRPDDEVVRLEARPLEGDDIGLVRDFDILGDTLYLLDVTGRIVVIEDGGAGLRIVSHIGRRGGGPGEFMQPSGLARVGGAVGVMDGTRVQFFTPAGRLERSKQVTLPCPMMLPSIAPATDGLFVHGACIRRGVATDTMMAVLAWSADTSVWDIIVAAPRFTTDGSFGSAFGARSLLTTGASGRHAFGGGETNCIWTVTDTGGRPAASETCPVAGTLYTAEPPPGLEARMRAGRIAGMNLSWPETLPAYVDRFMAGDELVLIRPFSADSVILQTEGGQDIAVAPLEGLIGCKAGGCLWVIEESDVPGLVLIDHSAITAMLRDGARE